MVKATQQNKEGKRKASLVQVHRKTTGRLEEKWSLLADNDKRAEQWLTKHFYGERIKRVSAAVRKSTKNRSIALPAVVFSTANQRMSERHVRPSHSKRMEAMRGGGEAVRRTQSSEKKKAKSWSKSKDRGSRKDRAAKNPK